MLRKLLILTLAVVLLAACGPTGPRLSGPITLTDGLEREVTLSAPAVRVVSLAPSNTEILFAVGAGEQTVGRDEFSDYPEAAKALPSVGGSMGQYSLEQIVALQPDLVLAGGINTPEQVSALEELGLQVYYLPNPATLEQMYDNLEVVGLLTGRQDEAADLVTSLQARVSAVDEKVAPLSYAPLVFYEIDASTPDKPYTAGPGTFIDLLIGRAGGINMGGDFPDAYPQVGLEQVIVLNPQVIILGDSMWGITPEMVAQRPGWGQIAAVQNGQVFTFDDNLVSRPGPRLVDGLEALAEILHPGLLK